MKKILVISIFISILLTLSGCEEMKRSVKDTTSSFVGLNRRVQIISDSGQVIKTYEGRIDIESNDFGNKVKFEVDGRRVIIYNMGVIVEEK